jgi:hypothetical protein
MPYGERVLNASGDRAEGDKLFGQYVYNDTSALLSIGLGLFVDLRDAAEFNAKLAATAISPAIVRTGGNVCRAETAAGTGPNIVTAAVYAPENPGDLPSIGDIVRGLMYGRGIVSTIVYNAGTAMLVGDVLKVDTTPTSSFASGHNTPVLNQTVGMVLATKTLVASQGSIQATGAGTKINLANAFVRLT